MEFNSLDDIIDFAITKEREAAAFYRKVSCREHLADKKRTFMEFAAEEEKHAAVLDALKTGRDQIELADYNWKWIIDIKRSNYVQDVEYHPDMSYREILILAAQREEKALAFYNDCLNGAKKDGAKKDGAKKVFKMLCQEEAKHKLALEGMLDDFMAEMGD